MSDILLSILCHFECSVILFNLVSCIQNDTSMFLTLSWTRLSCTWTSLGYIPACEGAGTPEYTWTGYRCYGDCLSRKNLANCTSSAWLNECMCTYSFHWSVNIHSVSDHSQQETWGHAIPPQMEINCLLSHLAIKPQGQKPLGHLIL